MIKHINLEDVFEGYCDNISCIYNAHNACYKDGHICEYMSYITGDEYATCHAYEPREGLCEWCGSELVRHIERHPYGDTYAEEILMICPKGC